MFKKSCMLFVAVFASTLAYAGSFLGNSIQNPTQFNPGDYLLSPNGVYMAIWQANDGNFVVYKTAGLQHQWNTNTENRGANSCLFQSDGNFAIYAITTTWVTSYYWDYQLVWDYWYQDYVWDWVQVYYQYPVTGNTCIWHANAQGGAGSTMHMQNDGNLAIYNSVGACMWHIGAHP